jgi:hypothetical protein
MAQNRQYYVANLLGMPQDQQDDGTQTNTFQGCKYRVSKEALIKFLSCQGEEVSDILEVIFKDSDPAGNMGSYSVKLRLNRDLPQPAPIMGRE